MTQRWHAQGYDESMAFVSRYGGELVEWLNAKAGERVLDWGCGTGDLAAELARTGAVVTGIDGSADMIARARVKYPQLDWRVADGQSYVSEEPADAIFSNAALHWMTDAEGAAASMSASLRPGGRLVAEFGAAGNIRLIREALGASWTAALAPGAPAWPWYFPTVGEYASLLERAGLEVRTALRVDRPTPLSDGEQGMRVWLATFANGILSGLAEEVREAVVAETERRLAETGLWDGVRWTADYERLRIVAVKR
ncbi:class I SAM-dependent methyltransferase [Paenibacillus xanthanilyticus]|uniref:Class I SAM-dependent methyltransferase n=1 Tax=Paenibacillus xanthanilyticus TaxID=1783531 RepID=A0ABV8KA83_9BACL